MFRAASWTDRLIGVLDEGLRAVATDAQPTRPSPARDIAETELSATEREESIRLMRVNRAGEIAAQALYSSQSLFAREPSTRAQLESAAREEIDHLAWCSVRIRELGGKPSLLDPFWYFGSAAIGAVAGASSDSLSLGFVAETERQVEAHIDDHLGRLPPTDLRSRAILEQMREDEARHGSEATAAGGEAIREPVRSLMAAGGEVLRRLAYRL